MCCRTSDNRAYLATVPRTFAQIRQSRTWYVRRTLSAIALVRL